MHCTMLALPATRQASHKPPVLGWVDSLYTVTSHHVLLAAAEAEHLMDA